VILVNKLLLSLPFFYTYFLALDKPNGLHRRLLKVAIEMAAQKKTFIIFLIAKLSVELLKKYLPISICVI
jgi:hypothetical protein